jgi:hypothetical protein
VVVEDGDAKGGIGGTAQTLCGSLELGVAEAA